MLKNGDLVNTQVFAPWEIDLTIVATEPLTGRAIAHLEVAVLTGTIHGKPNVEELIKQSIEKACDQGDGWDQAYELFDVEVKIKMTATRPMSEGDTDKERDKLLAMSRSEISAYARKISRSVADDPKWDEHKQRDAEIRKEVAEGNRQRV